VRRYRQDLLAGSGLTPLFPLFGAETGVLAREMIGAGLGAILTCVDPKVLDPSFAGREFDNRRPQRSDRIGQSLPLVANALAIPFNPMRSEHAG